MEKDYRVSEQTLIKNIFLSRFGNEENRFLTDNLRKNDKVSQANVLISRFVYAVGHDANFIIAKQFVMDQVGLMNPKIVGSTRYHLLDTRTETQIYSFDNESEFKTRRTILGVPDSLSFFMQFKNSDKR